MAAKAARRCVVAGRQLKRNKKAPPVGGLFATARLLVGKPKGNKKAKKLLVRQKKGSETFINVSDPLINLKYLNSKTT